MSCTGTTLSWLARRMRVLLGVVFLFGTAMTLLPCSLSWTHFAFFGDSFVLVFFDAPEAPMESLVRCEWIFGRADLPGGAGLSAAALGAASGASGASPSAASRAAAGAAASEEAASISLVFRARSGDR